MISFIRRPRQAIGLLYGVLYLSILVGYVFFFENDGAWGLYPAFTTAAVIWFGLSLAVKASMAADRTIELLNVVAVVAFLAMGFVYHPHPDDPNSLERFCYYLYLIGGPACDVFDFIYQGPARRPQEAVESGKRASTN